MAQHIIIYSHGFGTRRDDRGLFTDIVDNIPSANHLMFDYNEFDEDLNILTVGSLNSMSEKLRLVIDKTRQHQPDAVIDLVCHSQGCVVAGLLKPKGIRKTIFTGPPAKLSPKDIYRIFSMVPGSHINMKGDSTLQRRDGSVTIVNKVYWESIENIDLIALYNSLSEVTDLVLINATNDEIIGSKDFSGLSPFIKITQLDTGHNFEDEGRVKLVNAIKKEIEAY